MQMRSKFILVTCVAFTISLLLYHSLPATNNIMVSVGRVHTLSNMSIGEVETAMNSGDLRRVDALHLMAELSGLLSHLGNYTRDINVGVFRVEEQSKLTVTLLKSKNKTVNNNDTEESTKTGNLTNASNNSPAMAALSNVKVTLPNLNDKSINRVLLSYDKKFDNRLITKRNREGVRYNGPSARFKGKPKASDVMCRMKNVNAIKTMDARTAPFTDIGVAKYFPPKQFAEKYNFSRCAVVGSSFFLNNSGYGEAIDNHDAVLRFNDAPTLGFEKDVGNKTTFRVINSEVFHKLCTENLTQCPNETLFMWRTGPYNGNLYRWYRHAKGQALFSKYIAWTTAFPGQDVYLVHPQSLWLGWDTLIYFSSTKIKPIGPSSGFTGTLLMLGICDTVDVYGYVVDDVPNHSCHYYDAAEACAKKQWHPTSFETDVFRVAQTGSPDDAKQGRVTLNGFSRVKC